MVKHRIYNLLAVILFVIAGIGCQPDPYQLELIEINDSNLAIFRVDNPTDRDIMYMEFELTYLNEDGDVVKLDTVSLRMSEDSPNQVFVKAGGQTMLSQSLPEGATTATGRIIDME